jgi:hypothetical protein
MRKFVKSVLPAYAWNWLGTKRRAWLTRDDSEKTTREVFERIYDMGLWGSDSESTSGTGSHESQMVTPYVRAIESWASENGGNEMRAVDLGCGDFHVGENIFPLFKSYTAADIVASVIGAHQKSPKYSSVKFVCLDAIEEPLPEGEVIFIRQVLQHLSNDQISKILPKIRNFRHAIITEHLPSDSRLQGANFDKAHGGGIRIHQGSGVYLERSPFSLASVESRVLVEVPGGLPPDPEGPIRTTWYRFR